MSMFTYKFRSVQKVKEIFKKLAEKELAVIEMEISRWDKEYELLEEKAILLKGELTKSKIRLTVLNPVKDYELTIRRRQQAIKEKIKQLTKQKEIKQQLLIKRNKENKIFDTLEEIYKEDFVNEQNRLDRIKLDEVAAQKFARHLK